MFNFKKAKFNVGDKIYVKGGYGYDYIRLITPRGVWYAMDMSEDQKDWEFCKFSEIVENASQNEMKRKAMLENDLNKYGDKKQMINIFDYVQKTPLNRLHLAKEDFSDPGFRADLFVIGIMGEYKCELDSNMTIKELFEELQKQGVSIDEVTLKNLELF